MLPSCDGEHADCLCWSADSSPVAGSADGERASVFVSSTFFGRRTHHSSICMVPKEQKKKEERREGVTNPPHKHPSLFFRARCHARMHTHKHAPFLSVQQTTCDVVRRGQGGEGGKGKPRKGGSGSGGRRLTYLEKNEGLCLAADAIVVCLAFCYTHAH